MNSTLSNLLNGGPSQPKGVSPAFFDTPEGNVSTRNTENDGQNIPFDQVLASADEHKPMMLDVRPDEFDGRLDQREHYDSLAHREYDHHDVAQKSSTPETSVKAKAASDERNTEQDRRVEPVRETVADETNTETTSRAAIADETPHAERRAEPVETPPKARKNRSFLHRLRSRLATLGLGKGLSHGSRTQRTTKVDLVSRNAMKLSDSLNQSNRTMSDQVIQDVAADVARFTKENALGQERAALTKGSTDGVDAGLLMSERNGNQTERAATQRGADIHQGAMEREGRSDLRTGRQSGQEQQRSDTQGETKGRETSKDTSDKPMDGSRFEQAIRSHGQSAQARTARAGVQVSQAASTEAPKGDGDMDGDTARLVSKLGAKTATLGRANGGTRAGATPKQGGELQQLHQRILDHLDRVQIKTSGQRAKVTMHLAELGEVRVNVRMRMEAGAQGRIQVLMQATDAQTVSLLRQGSSALHAALEAKGYQQPILEVGQSADANNGESMDRGDDSASTQQDAQDDAAYQEANLAAMDRRRRDGTTQSTTSTQPAKTEKGLHVVA